MRKLCLMLLTVVVFFVISNSCFAANSYWDGGGADNLWSNPLNWLADTVPADVDIIYFGDLAPDAPQTIDLDINVTVSYLRCRATGNRDYTINTANGSAITNFTSTSLNIYSETSFATKFTVNVNMSDNRAYFQVDRNINGLIVINGNCDPVGFLFGDGLGVVELGGSNSFDYVNNYDSGEIVANNPHALGIGNFKTSGAGGTLSLVTNATILGYLDVNQPMNLRLKDSGTNDVTLTLQNRCLGAAVTVLPNEGTATGNLFIKVMMTSSHLAEWSLTTNSTLILDSALGATITWGANTDESVASISGSGALLVDGGNLVSFYPTNSYTGGTTVRSGILRIQASNRLPTNGDVVVESDGIFDTQTYSQTVRGLSGNGTVKMGAGTSPLSTNTVNGTLAPGLYGAGTLTLSDPGIFVLGASSTSLFELNGLSGTNDQLVMSYPTAAYTGLELAGTLEVENLGGLEVGDYTLFDLNSGPISGSFSSINMPRGFIGAVNITSGDVVLEVTHTARGTVVVIN